ncbi:MAG: D-sedoheptulose 7-phosphate isomerase [Verrucomicrobiota bacterium]
MKDLVNATINEHAQVVADFHQSSAESIAQIAQAAVDTLQAGNKICFFGNGGSAADAQHLATEFVVRFTRQRRALPAIAFTTDTSAITACANDFGFDQIFQRQAEALCQPGDLVIGISTSGTSPNVALGLKAAKAKGAQTVLFTGLTDGTCGEHSDLILNVPSKVTARIQECHILAGHILCDAGEAAMADS